MRAVHSLAARRSAAGRAALRRTPGEWHLLGESLLTTTTARHCRSKSTPRCCPTATSTRRVATSANAVRRRSRSRHERLTSNSACAHVPPNSRQPQRFAFRGQGAGGSGQPRQERIPGHGADEIRTPMNAILGMAHLLRGGVTPLQAERLAQDRSGFATPARDDQRHPRQIQI